MFRWLIPLALLGAVPASAQELRVKDRIVMGDVGLFCPQKVVGTEPAPDTVFGSIDQLEGDAVAVHLGQTVPMVSGLGFGVQFRAATGKSVGFADMVLRHPPMGDGGVTEQRWTTDVSDIDMTTSIYSFDFPYEMLPGRWSFALEQGGQTLFVAEFDVIPAPAGVTLESICSGGDFLS